jgi:hypothetical protein
MDPEEGQGWSREYVERMELAYKRFLTLMVRFPDQTIAPTKDVDKFWHGHILDKMKYAEDCQNVFGHFLHHFPYFGMRGEEDAANLRTAAERMHSIYEREYGERLSGSAFCMAAKPSTKSDSAFCMAANPAVGSGSAFCMAAKPSVNSGSAFCMAASPSAKPDSAFCMAASPAVGSGSAFCMAAKPAVKPDSAFCMAGKPTQGECDLTARPTLARTI